MTKVCKTIEVDDELLGEVMHRYVLDTEAEAVDFALRRLLPRISQDEAYAWQREQLVESPYPDDE